MQSNSKVKQLLNERKQVLNGSTVEYKAEPKKRGRPRNDELGKSMHAMADHGRKLPLDEMPYDPEQEQYTKKYNTHVLAKLSEQDRANLGLGVRPNEFKFRLNSLTASSAKAKKALTGKF